MYPSYYCHFYRIKEIHSPCFTVLCTSEDRRRATVQKEERARGVRARVAVVVVLHHCRRRCFAEEGGVTDRCSRQSRGEKSATERAAEISPLLFPPFPSPLPQTTSRSRFAISLLPSLTLSVARRLASRGEVRGKEGEVFDERKAI